jgi:hypothetical protein
MTYSFSVPFIFENISRFQGKQKHEKINYLMYLGICISCSGSSAPCIGPEKLGRLPESPAGMWMFGCENITNAQKK